MLGFIALLGSLWMAPLCGRPACSCIPPRDVPTSLEEADAVFSGTVTAVRTVGSFSRGPYPVRRVTLRVDRAWKGATSRTVVVTTGMGGGDCGYRFRRGEAYLVFAHRANSGSLSTGICGRTAALSRAAADVRALGEPAWRWRR
jgi:hypothetical protein